jgi:hypothetical protein
MPYNAAARAGNVKLWSERQPRIKAGSATAYFPAKPVSRSQGQTLTCSSGNISEAVTTCGVPHTQSVAADQCPATTDRTVAAMDRGPRTIVPWRWSADCGPESRRDRLCKRNLEKPGGGLERGNAAQGPAAAASRFCYLSETIRPVREPPNEMG